MSNIDELLKQYCPQGVIIKELWEVTAWDKRFNGVDKSKQPKVVAYKHVSSAILKSLKKENGTVKLLSTGKFDGYTTEIEAGSNLNCGEVITIPSGGSANIKYYNGKFVDSGNILAKAFDKTTSLKFIYYFLLSKNEIVESLFRGSGVKHPNMTELLKLQIPIPPLPIQEEIVNILDTFTTLEAELEAELEARKIQFSYYRDQFLSLEGEEVEWKTLGEVGEFVRGSGLQKKDFVESGVGCIHYGQIYTHYGTSTTKTKTFVTNEFAKKLKKASKNDLIIAGVSENVVDVCKSLVWLGDEDICISGDSYIFKHKQNPIYIAYLFQTNRFLEFKKKNAQGAKVTRLKSGSLPKYPIPVPSLETQENIANILGKMDSLVNDINVGLPAEIKARRKQYEYYRNQLLSFNSICNE